MARTIPLTHGYVAIVDDEDYEWLSWYKWRVTFGPNVAYAIRNLLAHEREPGTKGVSRMHRMVLGVDGTSVPPIDHINHDGLDNRRANLRLCTSGQNKANGRSFVGASSFKGVDWHKENRKWRAQINVNGKKRLLGTFVDEVDAAMAHDQAAIEAWGEYAYLNFPQTDTQESAG